MVFVIMVDKEVDAKSAEEVVFVNMVMILQVKTTSSITANVVF